MSASGTGIGQRRSLRTRTVWMIAGMLLVMLSLYTAIQSIRTPHPRIVVSPQTTRILEPLDKEENVDYLTALNQMASTGVTPQNNAAVLFVRAIDKSKIDPAERDALCKQLGIEPLPAKGEHLTELDDFIEKQPGRRWKPEERNKLEQDIGEPWTARQLPLAAQWLANNEKPLALIIAGTRLPKCYFPLISVRDSGLYSVSLAPLQQLRTAERLLAARAMRRLGEGDIAGAEQELLTCHRLGRLVGRTPFLIGGLVGIAIDTHAFLGDVRLMESTRLSAAEAVAYQRELRMLAPLPDLADDFDNSERFAFLDAVSLLARDRGNSAFPLPPFVRSSGAAAFLRFATNSGMVNWNTVMALGNEEFDKAVAAARRPTYPERQEAFNALDKELKAMRSETSDLGEATTTTLAEISHFRALSRQAGDLLMSLLMPALLPVVEAEARAQTIADLEQLGFALAAYRAEHGAYPDLLDVLAPKYIPQVPNDRYCEKPLVYKRQPNGYLLYAVGANGVDDGGKTFDSRPARGDDIVLKIPHDRPENAR